MLTKTTVLFQSRMIHWVPAPSCCYCTMLPVRPVSPGCSAQCEQKPFAVPRVAITSTFKAPVHIDVGGVIYTSSLETLTA